MRRERLLRRDALRPIAYSSTLSRRPTRLELVRGKVAPPAGRVARSAPAPPPAGVRPRCPPLLLPPSGIRRPELPDDAHFPTQTILVGCRCWRLLDCWIVIVVSFMSKRLHNKLTDSYVHT